MLKIFHAILFSILLIILAFCDNNKAADGVDEITEIEESNAGKNAQNQIEIIEEIDKGNGWMNKAKKMGLNSARKLTNYLKKALKIPFQNKINIEIGANVGTEMAKNIVEIGEIMQKILEIDVNVKIVSKKNGKNEGIVIKLKLLNGQTGAVDNRKIKISTLLDKHGKMEMNSVELGKQLIRQICGVKDCDQPENLPEFGENPFSVKPTPELHELDRQLRPMLLKLGSKFNTGRLWTDNPIPGYKNGFYVAFDLELMGNLPSIDSADSKIQKSEHYWLPVLKAQLDRFERNAPIRFVELQKNDKIGSSKFKNRLHFVIYIYHFWNASENGLQRNKEENNVYLDLDGKELQEGSLEIQEILLKALGVNAGEGLRVEYDRRDKFMPSLRRAFAQLNAAYGAENYAIQGQPSKLIRNQRIIDKPEVEFWMGPEYANFLTRKYEIPVVYDKSFKIAKKNKKLFDEVYANFAKNSVIQFVVHEEAPKDKSYVRIYHDDNDDSSNATVGHPTKLDSSYQGEKMEFGKNLMTNKYALYHEFMHVAGMEHEHQRADVEQFLRIDHEKGQKMLQMSKGEYAINYMPDATYLPINEYNPRSIMHYDMNWQFFEPSSEKAKLQKNQQMPTEPDQMDWENLNHFYGVGKGRTQFKVEIDGNVHPKIVNDIDGMRRL